MKLRFLSWLLACMYMAGAAAQSTIEIRIESPAKASIILKNGNAEVQYDKLDFTSGNGALIITNATPTDQYKINFKVGENNQNFIIPAAKIPKPGVGGQAGTTRFPIAADGTVPGIANSFFDPASSIEILVSDTDSPPKELGKFSAQGIGNTNPPRNSGSTISAKTQSALRQYVEDQVELKGYKYIASQNIIVDRNGTVHIYLDENLNPVYAYFPTTAKEGYDKFQFHILSTKEYTYEVGSSGKFDPRPIGDDIEGVGFPKIQSSGPREFFEFTSVILGPFSGNFPFIIQRKKSGKDDISLERTIKLLKVSRVSLDMGLVASWLNNPENIAIYVMPSGDSTLVADNPDVRGMLVAMLTFHFKPRNLNIPPRTFSERLGITVGLGLKRNLGSNLFLGLNVEIANGLFLNGGAHFGEINYPIDHEAFDYGKEKFTGTLVTRKRWDVRPYAAVSVDAALFVKAFRTLFSEQGSGN